MQEDPYAAAAEARALELRARKRAESALERCDDLMKTDDELITHSREVIDLAHRRLRQVPSRNNSHLDDVNRHHRQGH
jgi:hypothetical protein